MKNLILILLLLMSVNAHATQISYGTTYAPSGTVTSTNLNGNFVNVSSIVNGKLDNTNADTTNGYFFYKTVSVLPAAGVQGAVYFLTTDNSLNFDTGTAFNKAISLNAPTNGGIAYYNAGWNNLPIGTSGLALTSNGSIPGYGIVGSIGGGTGADLSASVQGNVPYFSATGIMSALATGTNGQVYMTQGASTNPKWNNSLSSVLDYGTSASASTSRQGTAWKLASGQVTLASGDATISNLTFTSGTSYSCFVTRVNSSDVSQAIQIKSQSSTTLVIRDSQSSNNVVNWGCQGT